MPNQLIPPPDLAPPSVKHLPPEKVFELWASTLDACEAFLLAGLRSQIGPDSDLQAAYREWYARHMDDHDQAVIQFLENLTRLETAGGQ
jgi:hypothetical protein